MIKHLPLILGMLAVPALSPALDATYYVTPEGAGEKTGATWDQAMDLAAFIDYTKFTSSSAQGESSAFHRDVFCFAAGTYYFDGPHFMFGSGFTLKGGYDAATGQKSETARTVFDGSKRTNTASGAIHIFTNRTHYNYTDGAITGVNSDGLDRKVTIESIDIENFTCTTKRSGSEVNWNDALPSALTFLMSGFVEIVDCNFRNNSCTDATNTAAGAVSLNRSNAVFRNCTFTGNSGTAGGAVYAYYSMNGTVVKDLYTTFDGCYFANNTTTGNGGAVYGRHTTQVNLINSTIVGNTAANGSAVWINGENATYANELNIVSSTIAGNTATADGGTQVFTNGTGTLRLANSIIVGDGSDAISDNSATYTSYSLLGNNTLGGIANGAGYAAISDTDNIDAANTYAAIFGSATAATDGTLTPVNPIAGMAPADITALVESQSWPYSVNTTLDQAGNERTDKSSNGALAVNISTTGISEVATDGGAAAGPWYTLQGLRLDAQPTAPGLYINGGRKVVVR